MANEDQDNTKTGEASEDVGTTPSEDVSKPPESIFSLSPTSSLYAAIKVAQGMATQNQKPEGNYTEENFIADMLTRGVEDYVGYLERDRTRRDKESFLKAEKALIPPVASKPGDYERYGREVEALKIRFGIGGSAKTL